MEIHEDEVKLKVLELGTIYDLLVVLYEWIDDKNCPSYIHSYYDSMNTKEGTIYIDVNNLLNSMLRGDIEFGFFLKEVSKVLSEDNYKLVSVHILLYFDVIFKEKENYNCLGFRNIVNIKRICSMGPLNNNQEKYRLFLRPQKSLLDESKAMKDMACRYINRKDGSNIFSNIDSYVIIRRDNRLPNVRIKKYGVKVFDDCNNEEKSIKIAILPVCSIEWFKVRYGEAENEKKYFEIEDCIEDKKENNNRYLKMLDTLAEENVDIVIFPELAMNKDTEKTIKAHLYRKTIQNEIFPIKLIFLGSLWNEGKNECVVLSSTGTELVRNRKKNPFTICYKDDNYTEKLVSREEDYEILDVDGIGRILYLICKDVFEDIDQVIFWNEYSINFEVVSSYSSSISYFCQQLKNFVEKYEGIGILANSCVPRKKTLDKVCNVGFLVTPSKNKHSVTEGDFSYYWMDKKCNSECTFANCAHIFELEIDSLWVENEKKCLCVRYDRKIRVCPN